MTLIRVKKTPSLRAAAFFIGDAILLLFALYGAFALRFEWKIPPQYPVLLYGACFVALKLPVFSFFRLYSMTWRYAGAYELVDILKATSIAQVLLAVIIYIMNPVGLFTGFPRSILLIDYLVSSSFIVGFRLSKRLYLHHHRKIPFRGGKVTLIVGAGSAGEMIVRDIHRQDSAKYFPVGFVDDDPGKQGSHIQGIKVLGKTSDIAGLAGSLRIESIILAIPSATSREMRRIIGFVQESGITDIRVLPGIQKILDGAASVSDLKAISIEDIVGREQVSVDASVVEGFIKGKRVLVTGAGGSIGSEIVRQTVRFGAAKVYALDVDETDIFNLEAEITKKYKDGIFVAVIADVWDGEKIRKTFETCRPEVVLHAAAYKHVPMMEVFPEEALRVNVFGTFNVVDASMRAGVKKFIMISTDKAVTPTSIMGTTKRVAEELVKFCNTRNATQFISVRFGNVVGSRGSVIPVFKEQIIHGGPVTVTHKDMTRYFMSIPEAVGLVLQAAAMGQGGEVFILDMGEPVRIVDVAEEMIRLHGLEPDRDIPIIFTGVRKGEKLAESLTTPVEFLEPTSHPKISKSKNEIVRDDILEHIERLRTLIKNPDKKEIVATLKEIVPDYTPDLTE